MAKFDTQNFVNILNQKWKKNPCPMCGSSNWNSSDKIFELREFHDGNIVLGKGKLLPVIPVTCINCGNTVFVNALVSNAIKANEDGKYEEPTE